MSDLIKFTISLRITHPNIRSDEISGELGLVPKFSYTAGDEKVTPKGNKVPGVRMESFWCHEFAVDDGCIEFAIFSISNVLAKNKAFLDRLSATGGRLEYFIGLFSYNGSGFVLKDDLLRQLADLKVSLAFDIYA